MVEIDKKYKDEIDLLELFKIIWKGKLVIIFFMFFVVLGGVTIHLTSDPVYKTKLHFSIDTLPPFYLEARDNEARAALDLKKMFYNITIFNEWKNNQKDVEIVYEDFSMTENFKGFTLSKNKYDRMALLVAEKVGNKKGIYFLSVNSNRMNLLDNFFNYINYVNKLLTDQYLFRSKQEVSIIENRLKNYSSNQSTLRLVDIDRYISATQNGGKVFNISYPSKPKKISSGLSLTIPSSVLAGLIIGVFFVLIRHFFKWYKEVIS
jgi:LPS O-antigen subunit length determinant protein (WzzB/FepE family)